MNDDPIEDLVFDFLEEAIANASVGDALEGLELHDTVYKKIEQPNGIRIGNATSSLSPNGDNEIQEWDAVLILVCYAKIESANKTERSAARKKSFQISRAVAKLFFDDEKMDGRVCNARVLSGVRDFDSINSQPYSVVNLPIVFNESGDIDFNRR